MTALTVFALFGDDVRIAFGHPDDDWAFFGISTLALVLFVFELLISSVGKKGYFMGFYFALDVVSTLSMIPDTGLLEMSDVGSSDNDNALKAGRASKASKATRIIRLVRLVRMVRIVKLWKMHGAEEEVETIKDSDIEPTKVGKKLNEMTTRKLILMILSTVMLLPYLEVTGWVNSVDDSYAHLELENIYNVTSTGSTPENVQNVFIDQFVDNVGKDLLYFKICRQVGHCEEQFPHSDYKSLDDISTKLRGSMNSNQMDQNLIQYQQLFQPYNRDGTEDYQAEAIIYVDYSELALFNIFKTIIVMSIIVYGTVNFQRDAQTLVLDPINRMVTVVHTLSENPLANTSVIAGAHSEENKKKSQEYEHYETILLEKTIVKIGGLLQIGFGAAGSAIIGKNMKAGALNPMVPGKMITSIYGFCDIRNFTDTTECLQEEVMVYVNKLGSIVHKSSGMYYGAANKNVGDAFLVSWKVCDDLLPGFYGFEDEPDEEARLRACEHVRVKVKGSGEKERYITPTEMADSALAAFIKCYVDLDHANTHGSLTEYLSHAKVVKR